jgi:hypothetical protein
MSTRGLRAAGAAVGLMALGTGCIILPTPEHNSGQARANLTRETPARIQPGVATREEVLLGLGEPDAVSSDERRLVYRSEKIIAYWIAGGGYTGGIGALTKDRYLLVELDEAGVVTRHAPSTAWLGSTAPEKLLRGSKAGNHPSGGEAVRFSATAMWYPRCERLTFSTAGSPAGNGHLLLTATALEFRDLRQLGNAGPELVLPYRELSSCQIGRFGFGRHLVVRTQGGMTHVFLLSQVQGVRDGEDALEAVLRFLEAQLAGGVGSQPASSAAMSRAK